MLAAAVAVGEATSLDFAVQDRLHDPATHAWPVDALSPVPRLVFYDGPKAAIIALGAGLLVLLAGPARWRARVGVDRARLVAAIAVMAVVPTLVGFLKARSDVFCPTQLVRYGGTQERRVPFTPRPEAEEHARRGHCWPAGHASGGFALVGLALLARTDRRQRLTLAATLAVGWTMGAYQILKGAHFLSHTLVTMMIACLLAAVVARALPAVDPRVPRDPATVG